MKKQTIAVSLLVSMMVMLTSCSVVGGIFKAGMGVGIFIVVVVVAVIIFLISKFSGGSKS